jgi:hypothetical protein
MSQTLPPVAERKKLLELRDKTDRQVFRLIHSRLDAGLMLAAQAEYERPLEILHEAERLLPVLSAPQRQSLDAKLEELRLVLPRPYAAAAAS